MFSPSLVSMMVHTLWEAADWRSVRYDKHKDLALALKSVVSRLFLTRWPEVPVVGRSRNTDLDLEEIFGGSAISDQGEWSTGVIYFWGRIPIDRLVNYFERQYELEPDYEYLDLGSPLFAHSGGAAAKSASSTLIAQTATAPIDVTVAFLDRGVKSIGNTPENFAGKLTHVIPTDVDMGDHASKVLHTLLDRLAHHQMLAATELMCGLVTEPDSPIGLKCFEHANSVEMLNVAKAIGSRLSTSPTPAAINISLGTHVGPHDGQSPIEDYLGNLLTSHSRRFCFVAAGNEGRRGLYAKCALTAGVRDYLTIRTGGKGCSEFLVELWWSDPSGTPCVSADVDIVDSKGAALIPGATLQVSASASGNKFPPVPSALTVPIRRSLIAAHCAGNMNCIAFAVSAPNGSDLSLLTITVALDSTMDVLVNGWVVVCDDPDTTFVGGGIGGTLCVPSTSDKVVCVTGVDSTGQPWPDSSRGPAHDYGWLSTPPQVAHLVDYPWNAEAGTSFSSPRACADASTILADPNKLNRCGSASDLLGEMLQAPRMWKNSRVGYGSLWP
jgi:hypothetical protein